MKMKTLACLAFLLNTTLFATSYSVSKEALARIEPIVFTYFVMMGLVPVAVAILIFSWRSINREAFKSGVLLGSCQCLGLFTIYIALKYNTATSTAFFPSLNGFLAALCTWLFLRQSISKATWLAGIVSLSGAVLLIFNSPMGGARGALIAFLGGLFCTFYVFLADHEQRGKTAIWPLFAIQLLTMALWANLVVLLFGDWQAVAPVFPRDAWVITYMSLGTICLPTLITVLLQRYISPVTVSFIYILEPILGAAFATFYLGELLPINGYLGGSLIVAGAVIHTWLAAEHPARSADDKRELHRRLSVAGRSALTLQASPWAALGYPLLCFGVGAFILFRFTGFPPASWVTLYRLLPSLPNSIQQGHSGELLLFGQELSWFIAWVALLLIGCLVFIRAARYLSLLTSSNTRALPARTSRTARADRPLTYVTVSIDDIDTNPELAPVRPVSTAPAISYVAEGTAYIPARSIRQPMAQPITPPIAQPILAPMALPMKPAAPQVAAGASMADDSSALEINELRTLRHISMTSSAARRRVERADNPLIERRRRDRRERHQRAAQTTPQLESFNTLEMPAILEIAEVEEQ